MSDARTLRAKLQAMAEHPRSDPNEAAVAAAKLKAMGSSAPPPHRPTAVGAVFGWDSGTGWDSGIGPSDFTMYVQTSNVGVGSDYVIWTMRS
ncbi:MAG TPA: hypothetical protein VFW92_11850 [Candidatus Limnocylindrales bacterium]|nr:hypothetical protein [Candidatus Limnocylindrales bacterium]